MNSNKNLYAKLIPVMLCFFAMGFVDLVGIASNYVKADLDLTDSQANIFPSLVFFWFLIFSVPTGILMNKIGRKKTVLLSLIVTFASLLLPIFGDGYTLMLISFSLLGIGNALMHELVLHMTFDEQSDMAAQSRRHGLYLLSEDATFSRTGFQVTAQDIDSGGLARTVLSQQSQDASFGYCETKIFVNQPFAVIVRQIVTFDNMFHLI